jgi:hypothetical protein
MKIVSRLTMGVMIILLLASCAPSKEQLAATNAAETVAAASPTSIPTETPTPTSTGTPTSTPTETPIPSKTPTATQTPKPTRTPTITPTPGPFSFYDDFSTNTGGWVDCEECHWENGTLIMGPFDPSSFFHINYCTGCEENYYYTMEVDVTFIDGQVDRFYGVTFADGQKSVYYLGISPWGWYELLKYHWDQDYWDQIAFKQSSAVIGSYGTNHFKIVVQPAANNSNTAEYYVYLNDNLLQVFTNQAVELTSVGLGMDFHAQVAAYDNWKYTVIEP